MDAWDVELLCINAVSIDNYDHDLHSHRKFIHRENTASCFHGMVRLVNGTNNYEGRVEICLQGIWKTVCGHFWSNHEARVVCTQLGFQGDGIGVSYTYCSQASINIFNVLGAQAFGQAHFG